MTEPFREKTEPFRTKVEHTPERAGKGKEPDMQPTVEVEVPYTDYEKENGQPYSVDHFELGKYWNEGVGGFEEEVGVIENYIMNKINSGEWANDQTVIKGELKKMEKLTNMKDEPRAVVKVATITAHIKFLMEADGIRKDYAKYTNSPK